MKFETISRLTIEGVGQLTWPLREYQLISRVHLNKLVGDAPHMIRERHKVREIEGKYHVCAVDGGRNAPGDEQFACIVEPGPEFEVAFRRHYDLPCHARGIGSPKPAGNEGADA